MALAAFFIVYKKGGIFIKILKLMFGIIALYIAATMLISIIPGGNILAPLLNPLLVITLLMVVLWLVTGGMFNFPLVILKSTGLMIGLVALTMVIHMFLGPGDDTIASTLINEVIPGGKFISALVFPALVNIEPFYVLLYIARDTAKFMLQVSLSPITTWIVFEFIFSADIRNKEHSEQYHRKHEQFGLLSIPLGVRAVVSSALGKLYSAYLATFLFNAGVSYFANLLGLSSTVVLIIFAVISVGLFLLAILSPILKSGILTKSTLTNMLFTFIFNLIVVFLVSAAYMIAAQGH